MNVECPHCKATIQVPVSNAGEVANCPYCTGQFMLPTPPNYQPGQRPPVATSQQALPNYQTFIEKKVLVGILAILFGALGIHKFVLGLESGKIMLFLTAAGLVLGSCLLFPALVVFGMSFVGLVEGIIYLTKSDDQFYQTYAIQKKQWF